MEGRRIPPFEYGFDQADIEHITAEIQQLLEGKRHLTMGAHGRALEAAFATYNGTRHAVSVASGTAALEIILRTLHVSGGEVILPTNTFGATPVAALRAGAKPVFADAAEDLSINVADIEQKISRHTRAVITVHIGGAISPHTMALRKTCAEANIPLIEDAAHAIGAGLDGVAAGGFGAAAAFSLFSTKVMTSGEGGLIATNDDAVRDTALLLRDHAKETDGSMSATGYNWRLTEVQAILAKAQLRRLDEIIARRNETARIYDEALADVPGLQPLKPPDSAVHNRYKYIVFLERANPEQVRQRLHAQYDIDLGGFVYRVPCHQQPAFKDYATGSFPLADRLCASHICLPIYPNLTNDDGEYVAAAVRAVVKQCS